MALESIVRRLLLRRSRTLANMYYKMVGDSDFPSQRRRDTSRSTRTHHLLSLNTVAHHPVLMPTINLRLSLRAKAGRMITTHRHSPFKTSHWALTMPHHPQQHHAPCLSDQRPCLIL